MIEIRAEGLNTVYPIIKYTGDGTIVLFTAPKTGVRIGGPAMFRRVGEFRDTWFEDNFKPYPYSVILKNIDPEPEAKKP